MTSVRLTWFTGIDRIDPDTKAMVKKNSVMAREMRAIGGIHALERKKVGAEAVGSATVVAEVTRKKPPVAVSDDAPDEVEIREEAPLLSKKRLRTASRELPSYRSRESAADRAQGKKLVPDSEGPPGLVEIWEDKLQEYESFLLDIPSDKEKDYFLGLGYDEAFRQMIMSWGVVRIYVLAL